MSQGTAKPKNRAKETGGNLEKLLTLHQVQVLDRLTLILIEQRVQTIMWQEALRTTTDVGKLRAEVTREFKR